MLSPNVIIPFDGNHADIPPGFERDTRFDGRYPKGATSGYGDTGGSATHTHTLTHNHAISSHRHTVSVGGRINGNTYSMGMSGGCVEQDHSHFGIGYTGYSNGETCQNATINFDAASSEPPYYTVIFIKSIGYNLIPTNGMIYRNTSRAGMSYHSASDGKFLRGADTGQNAGGTGGAATHSHTQSHTHTANNHSHATGYAGYEAGRGEDGMSSPGLTHGNDDPPTGAMHAFTVQNASQSLNSNTTASNSVSSEPYHKQLMHYKASQTTLPQPGDICITTDSEIPIGWLECDGADVDEDGLPDTPNMQGFYVKNNATAGGTGGANSHSHENTHSHTGNGTHTHTINNPMAYSGDQGGHNGSGRTGVTSHQHNASNCQNVTANYENNTVTTTSSDNAEPPYIKVRFIQFQFAIGGAALFALA